MPSSAITDIQVEEPILWTVQLFRLYTTDGTAKTLESAERTGGTAALLKDCVMLDSWKNSVELSSLLLLNILLLWNCL